MYTEILKIIEGGLDKDKEKVISYANLLANKLADDGEKSYSERVLNLIKGKSVHPVYLDELMSLPVDQDNRMNIVDVSLPANNMKIILPELAKIKVEDFIEALKYKEKFEKAGIEVQSSLLLYGPPGCGKTSIAHYISQKTQLPLVVARLDSLVSSLLGNTSKNIRKIFEFAKKTPCILFLDEFDAIAKARDDEHELGELKRVVNSLLQNIDEFNKDNILIAATNHHNLLDVAIWRRFNTIIEIPKPSKDEVSQLINLYLNEYGYDFCGDDKKSDIIAKLLDGLSPSDIKNICINSMKRSVMNDEKKVTSSYLIYETYLFKSQNIFSQKELAKYLNENGVSQVNIQKILKISIRQVRNLLE